jgi:hypothetical protein
MNPPFPETDRCPADDAHLFLVPLALLAAAIGVCALLLVLHLLPTGSGETPNLEAPTTGIAAAPAA